MADQPTSTEPTAEPTPGTNGENGSIGPRPTLKFTVTVNISISVGWRSWRRGRGERLGLVDGRSAESCSGNLYPDNDATKICTA